MIKWNITYTTYDGETVSEDFYFHLNKAELAQMQFDANGVYINFIERLSNERDIKELGKQYANIILAAYGKKSDDGRVFRKNDALREEFKCSEAYPTLYMELLSSEEKAAKFVKGILPADLQGADIAAHEKQMNN